VFYHVLYFSQPHVSYAFHFSLLPITPLLPVPYHALPCHVVPPALVAVPLPQGVAGWVHEGLLAAAAYVVSNTVDALAEAAQRCPGWPLVVAGGTAAAATAHA